MNRQKISGSPNTLEYKQWSLKQKAIERETNKFKNESHTYRNLMLVRPSPDHLEPLLPKLVENIIGGGNHLANIRIDLSRVSKEMAEVLSHWLAKPSSTHLELSGKANSEVIDSLIPNDINLVKLKSLMLENMIVGPESRLFDYLSSGVCELELLRLRRNFRSDSAWERLCATLPSATQLKDFRSSRNLDDDVKRAEQLGEAVTASKSIQILDLGEETIVSLNVLRKFTSKTGITHLTISYSCIANDLWGLALKTLNMNTNLQEVNFPNGSPVESAPNDVLELLCRNRALHSAALPMITTRINKEPFFASHNKKIIIVGSGGKSLLKRFYYQFEVPREKRKQGLIHEFYLQRVNPLVAKSQSSTGVPWRVMDDQMQKASVGSFFTSTTTARCNADQEWNLAERNVADMLGKCYLRKLPTHENGSNAAISKLNCWVIPENLRGYGKLSGFCTPGAIYCVALDAARIAMNFREEMDVALSTIAAVPEGSPIIITTIYGRKDEKNFERAFNIGRLELMQYFSKQLYAKLTKKDNIISCVKDLKVAAINVPLFPLSKGQNCRFWRKLCALISKPFTDLAIHESVGVEPSLANLRWYMVLTEARNKFKNQKFVTAAKFLNLFEEYKISDSVQAITYFHTVGEILICADDVENFVKEDALIVFNLERLGEEVKKQFIKEDFPGLFKIKPVQGEERFCQLWTTFLIEMNILVEVRVGDEEVQFLNTKFREADDPNVVSKRKLNPFNLMIKGGRLYSGQWFSLFLTFLEKKMIENELLEPGEVTRSQSVLLKKGLWTVFDRKTDEIYLGVSETQLQIFADLEEIAREAAHEVDSCFKDHSLSSAIVIPKVKNGFATEKLSKSDDLTQFIEHTREAVDRDKLWRPTPKRDLFLSHNWGAQQMNHKRVLCICEILRFKGFSVWLDDEDMQNRPEPSMKQGIENCHIFLAFLTEAYITKALKKNDNCNKELTHAMKHFRKKLDNLVFVGLEKNPFELFNSNKSFRKKVKSDYFINDFGTTEKLFQNIDDFTLKTKNILDSIDSSGGVNTEALYRT